jgi:hypothetical protein
MPQLSKGGKWVFGWAIVGPDRGEQFLVVRGSNLALGFLLRGPIVDEPRLHPELEVYQS